MAHFKNVLSLFDGMSCGQIALNRGGHTYDHYYASEIDKYAIEITQKNYPNTTQLGDVNNWRDWVDKLDFSKIDLVTGGFPCQAWSLAGKQKGDKDPRGALFWVMLDIVKYIKSKNPDVIFLLENVKMKKDFEDYITYHTEEALGKVNKYLINSALVSAQTRKRFYWTNIENVAQPKDKEIYLYQILEGEVSTEFIGGYNPSYKSQSNRVHDLGGKYPNLCAGTHGYALGFISTEQIIVYKYPDQMNPSKESHGQQPYLQNRLYNAAGKAPALTSSHASRTRVNIPEDSNAFLIRDKSKTIRSGGRGSTDRHEWDSVDPTHYRKLTPKECERLQTVPDDYTEGVSKTQRYKMLGNGWTVDVIVHIYAFIDAAEFW